MAAPSPPAKRSFWAPVNLPTSILLIFPLFLLYQVGVLAVPASYNGADFITAALLRLLHGQMGLYLIVNLVLAIAFAITVIVMRKKNALEGRLIMRVLAESTIYAVTMGSVIVLVMVDLLHIDPRLMLAPFWPAGPTPASEMGLFGRMIVSLGAGVHEELVFRLALLGALVPFGEQVLGMRRLSSVIVGFLVSSVIFSAAHHVVGGEPFRIGVFVYRIFCGLIFATIYQTRGFAVAVYTHAFYDLYVLVIHG